MSSPSNGTGGTGLREHMLLFSRFLRSPRTVGALTPSSRAVAEVMLEQIDLQHPVRMVELGPGTGALTAPIVERLGPDDEFLAIDIDPAFCAQVLRRWPSIDCVCASAEQLDVIAASRQMLPVDHILSGLPFTSLPVPVTTKILQSVASVLRPGGTFSTFQYVHAYGLPSAASFRRRMSAHMGSKPRMKLVLRNFPAALVITWQKQASPAGLHG